jgi:hypothetical protein
MGLVGDFAPREGSRARGALASTFPCLRRSETGEIRKFRWSRNVWSCLKKQPPGGWSLASSVRPVHIALGRRCAPPARRRTSAEQGESHLARLTTRRSQVQILPPLLRNGPSGPFRISWVPYGCHDPPQHKRFPCGALRGRVCGERPPLRSRSPGRLARGRQLDSERGELQHSREPISKSGLGARPCFLCDLEPVAKPDQLIHLRDYPVLFGKGRKRYRQPANGSDIELLLVRRTASQTLHTRLHEGTGEPSPHVSWATDGQSDYGHMRIGDYPRA